MSPAPRPAPLSQDQFLAYVADALELSTGPSPESRLYEDLGLDSLAVYELLVAVEELGVEIDEERWVRSTTLADCYRGYLAALPPAPGTPQALGRP